MLWIAVIVLLADQATKYLVRAYLAANESIPLIPNIFHFTHVRNPGAAFGLLAHQTGFFIAVTLAVIAAIIYFYRQPTTTTLVKAALALQLGGAAGNLIDRLRFGYVTDFLDFRFYPVFNVADSAIVVGVALLIWYLLFNKAPDAGL